MKKWKNVLAFLQKRAIKAIFKNSIEGVLIIDQNGFVVWLNQTIRNKNELNGKHVADIVGQDYVWPPRLNKPIRRQIDTSFVEYIATPLKEGYLITVRELNAENGIVSEMEKKHCATLLAVEKKYSEQTGHVIHDIRTPMNAVLGFTDLSIEAMQAKNYEEVSEYLQHVMQAGKSMLRDIDSYLSFVKLQNGVGGIKKENINLHELSESTKQLIEVGFRWKGIRVDVDSNGSIVQGDYSLLKNAVMNALKNAAEATPEGGHIKIKIIEDKNSVEILIINPGYIAVEDLPKIFNSDNNAFSTKGGNGLGTKIIKMVVEAHKGKVSIKNLFSQVIVTITLPKN